MSRFIGVRTYIIDPMTGSIQFIDEDDSEEWLYCQGKDIKTR